MTQLVFLHGPGAGACSKAFRYQLEYFRGSLAPDLPGHPSGTVCSSAARYAEWVRGWLWAQGYTRDLVLSGYTMGANIALQYALDYPEEVKGLVLSTVALRPKGFKPEVFSSRLAAQEDPVEFEKWIESMWDLMQHIDPPAYREELLALHRAIGPRTQHDDLKVTEMFDVRDRIATLKPKLLLVQGAERTHGIGDWEGEIHRAVPASQLVSFPGTGHFPMIEQPAAFNRAVDEFLETLK